MTLKKVSIEGITILTPSEELARELYDETFDPKEYTSLKSHYNYFDCGAHIGIHLLKLKHHYPNMKVTCFEPDPNNFPILEKNARQLKNVILINAALSNKRKKKTKFYTNGDDTRGNSITEQWGQRPTSIETIANTALLSDYITQNAWVKLDIEGEELKVIEELEKNKKLDSIMGFHIEIHTTNKDKRNKYRLIKAILKKNSFRIIMDKEKEFEYMLPNDLLDWKRRKNSRIFTIVAVKK